MQNNQGYYGSYGQPSGYPPNWGQPQYSNYSKGTYYGNPPNSQGYYNDNRYGGYGQQGYNYGGKPYGSGCDECLACLTALCCCCLMCDMLN